ncbi:MAG TPA: hypothetical protein VFB38_07605 [Chthonomonadaceae bacterium]|nr:hypothetical protein [Chthonomonadaceae bacterium]
MPLNALLSQLVWFFFLFMALAPVVRQRFLIAARRRMIQEIERVRGSRVIVLIHRQESLSFLGIPLFRYITMEDAEDILRAIRLTPDTMPIDLVLHTPGGLVLASQQIANALCDHAAKVTAFVPHYAMSGGTLLALAADEIVMDPHAVLGSVDPQIGQYPAASILKVVEAKEPKDIDDQTIILADVSRKALRQVYDLVRSVLVSNGMEEGKAEELSGQLTQGVWTHDYPIGAKQARELGLPISTELPVAIHELMSLYPQPSQRTSSVDYVPVPYAPVPAPPTPTAPPAERRTEK